MHRCELAIHGHGLLPGLLAVHLLGRDPGLSVLLLSADKTIGGEVLEPVVASSLSPAAIELVEPFVVMRWPGYFIRQAGGAQHHDDEVLLLDPVQLWIELQSQLPPDCLALSHGALEQEGEHLAWPGNSCSITRLVDLGPMTRREQSCEIVGLDVVRSLPLPVLADFDTDDDHWNVFQHLPLGDERVLVRKCRIDRDPETELTVSFGRMLSELIAF
jgi:hypothetical protein